MPKKNPKSETSQPASGNLVVAEKKTKTLKTREAALRHLDLPSYFIPCAKIAHRLDRLGVNLEEAVSYLRTSEVESAMIICAYYDRVPRSLTYRIDLDDLIAAARADMHKIFGLIAESYSKINSLEASMIAAGKSPNIMQARTFYAQQPDGHKDAKLVLQTSGVAPVPRNQVSTNYIIGNKIDQSKTQVAIVGVPSLEDVVNDCFQAPAAIEGVASKPEAQPAQPKR